MKTNIVCVDDDVNYNNNQNAQRKGNIQILESDTIKQVEMKEKIKKSISVEQENYSKPNYIAEISSKG